MGRQYSGTSVPLSPKTIDDLLKKRRLTKELTADDILEYKPGVPVDLYAMTIGVKPGASLNQKREWGKLLIIGARNVLVDLGRRGIVIRSIQAHSSLPDGIRLMRHAGFTETVSSTPNMHDFIIEVERSGLPFVMDYKAALDRWRKEKDKTA